MEHVSLSHALQTLPLAHKKSRGNVQKLQEKVKRRCDVGKEENFAVGDKVLRQSIHEEERNSVKMESIKPGPLKIVHIVGESADLVGEKRKSTLKINIDQLT